MSSMPEPVFDWVRLKDRLFHSGMVVLGVCLLSVLSFGVYTQKVPVWLFYPVPPAILAIFASLVLEWREHR